MKSILRWLRYRLHPGHRYHVLKLHDPGYSDPRHQMILAVMGIAERYVDELRYNWYGRDLSHLSDAEVCSEYYHASMSDEEEYYSPGWVEHYRKMTVLMDWWEGVKGCERLDDWPELAVGPHDEDTVDEMLHFAITCRKGMWT